MAIGTTILACFQGFIGLRSCTTTEPGSGLFINDLPGISNEILQTITEAEEETFLVTWSKIETEAILSFRSQLLSQVNNCFQINKMATIECVACENKELLALSLWYLLGNKLMVWALYNWNNSRYSTVDSKAVEEIRDFFFAQFEAELAAAVPGIDVMNSTCVDHEESCVVPNGRIHTRYSRM